MTSEIAKIRAMLASLPALDRLSLSQRRARLDRAKDLFPLPGGTVVEHIDLGGIAATRVRTPGNRAEHTILYLHGGAYVLGSPESHCLIAAGLAAAAQAEVLLPRYRLAPEHPFPAAVEDALAAYRALLDGGHPASAVVIGGSSAGGGLAAAALMAARDSGLPLPAAGMLLSPWVDLTCSLPSIDAQANDPMLTKPLLLESAALYLNGRDPRTPLASPLFGDLRGLPRLLIQVGGDEMLLDDARELDRRAREQGVEAVLEIWPNMIHGWHRFGPLLREAREALACAGEYARAAVQSGPRDGDASARNRSVG